MSEQQAGMLPSDDWAGEMGAKWLANLDRFESMIAPAGAALMQHADFRPGERVVDIGCGGGGTSIEIARRVGPTGQVLGLDISADLVTAARGRASAAALPWLDFTVADAATAMPEGAPFDRLFSRFGSMFFTEPYPAFANLHRMVRPSGRIDLGVWAPARENGWMARTAEVVGRHIDLPKPIPRAPGPCALDDPDYVRDLLGKAGFDDIAIKPWHGDQIVGGAGASPEEAVAFIRETLTIGQLLAGADEGAKAKASADLLDLFRENSGARGVVLPAKIWIVTAHA